MDPTASPGSTLVDSASVAGQQPDPDLSNNDATLNLNVQNVSDLSVTATAQAGRGAPAGQPLTYTITVSNLGPADEPDAILRFLPPA